MKKLVACTFCIALVVLMVFHFAGGNDAATNNLTGITEASFDVSSTDVSSDGTAFLVGSFESGDGTRLSFNGCGSVTVLSADGSAKSGEYSLVQYKDHSALVRFSFPDDTTVYTFELANASGSFSLTDSNGKTVTYSPYLA